MHANAGTIIDKEAANEMLKEHHSEFNADIPFYGHQYLQNKNQVGHHTSALKNLHQKAIRRQSAGRSAASRLPAICAIFLFMLSR